MKAKEVLNDIILIANDENISLTDTKALYILFYAQVYSIKHFDKLLFSDQFEYKNKKPYLKNIETIKSNFKAHSKYLCLNKDLENYIRFLLKSNLRKLIVFFSTTNHTDLSNTSLKKESIF